MTKPSAPPKPTASVWAKCLLAGSSAFALGALALLVLLVVRGYTPV